MITLFKVYKDGTKVHPFDVEYHNDEFFVEPGSPVRCVMHCTSYVVHTTWEDAHADLAEQAKLALESAQRRVTEAQAYLRRAEAKVESISQMVNDTSHPAHNV